MRRWEEKQRRIRPKNGPNAASSDAKFAAVSPSTSPSSPQPPPLPRRSPTAFGDFIKTTAKFIQSQNERAINRDASPMDKGCDSASPSGSRPNADLERRTAPREAPPSPARLPELVFDLSSLSSTSSSFVPSSPVPSSSTWRQTPKNFPAGAVPKSAVLMSKCQSFLKSSSSSPSNASSAAIPKNEMATKKRIDQPNSTEQREENREKHKKDNENHLANTQEESIFNFEGLFEIMDNSDETFGDRENAAVNGPKREMALETEEAKDERQTALESEKAKGGLMETEPQERKKEAQMEVETLFLSLARENESLDVKCDWPFRLNEECASLICQQKASERKDETTQIGEGAGGGQRTCQGPSKQSHHPRSARRAPRPHTRRGRPPPLPPLSCGPSASASLPVVPFVGLSAGGCSLSPSTSSASPPIPSNAVYSIRIGGIHLRNVPLSSAQEKDVQLVVAIRLDGREVFRSCPVHLSRNCCVISEEFCMELPRSSVFHSFQLSLLELTEGARIQRCIGRMRLTRHELVAYGNAIQDRWLPIARIRPSELTETLGAICAGLSWNGQCKILTLRVFDFTIWSLPTSNGRGNVLQRHCDDGGRLFLKCRLCFGHSAFGAIQKMRLMERRSVEPVRFDCSHFFAGKMGQRPPPRREGASPPNAQSPDEWAFCRSPCATPTSAPSADEHFQFSSRHFKFPPPPSTAFFHQQQKKGPKTPKFFGESHLYIKLYGKPNYSEDSFCGFVHIPLETETMKAMETPHGPNWHLVVANQPFSSSSVAKNQQNSGEVRLKLRYDVEEVHPFVIYRPLYLNLVRSLNVDPHACSLISLIQCLPVDLENLAKPLMKIFVHSNQIRQFFRAICMDYVKSCNDVNTLFRSQSLASKVMYEMMKFVGHNYLFTSLKPLIDLIFAERKNCEIDPSKLKPGDSIDQNFRSITTYAELAFDQVVNSLNQCPKALRELFSELRGVVEQIYPNRQDVARLAVSSFLIMRFFAAAILNPKLFSLKLETPDVEVSRTLVLVSKVLQRISNCVVSAHPLTNKEQWLTPVLQRFSDRDKIAMILFLDKISKKDVDDINQPFELNYVNNENISPASGSFCETTILKSGFLIERRCSPVKKRSFKNLMHSKRRFVLLTEASLFWHKSAKEGTASSTSSLMSDSLTLSGDFNVSAEQHKSQIALSDVTSVGVLPDAKNAFRVCTMNTEVHFQANSEADLNEWIILIQKQQRRQLMFKNRSVLDAHVQQQMFEIDLERELHAVYTNLASHMDTLCDHNWCCRFECERCNGGKYTREECTASVTDYRKL